MTLLGRKSVNQCSKFASLLYTLYTLDIGKINKIMQKPEIYKKLTYKEINKNENDSHKNIVYIDEMSQIIGYENSYI